MADGTVTIRLSVKQRRALAELQKFKGAVVGIAQYVAVLGGAIGAVGFGSFIQRAVMTAARTEELGVVLDHTAEQAGHARGEIKKLEKSVSDLGIRTQVSRNLLATMITTELDLTKSTELANVARNAAIFSMEDTSDALEGILHGIVTLSPLVLRQRHIFVNMEMEYKKYADAANRSTLSLTMQEKQQIVLNAVLKSGINMEGAYEAAMTTAGKQVRSMTRYLEEMFNELGTIGLPVLREAVAWFKDLTARTREWAEENQVLMGQKVRRWVKELSDELKDSAQWIINHREQIFKLGQVLTAAAIAHKIGMISYAIGILVGAMRTLDLTFATTVVGQIAIGLAAVAGILVYLGIQAAYTSDQTKTLADRTEELIYQYGRLAEEEELTRGEKAELKKISEELNELIPENILALMEEAAATEDLAAAYELLATRKNLAKLLPKAAGMRDDVTELQAELQTINTELKVMEERGEKVTIMGGKGAGLLARKSIILRNLYGDMTKELEEGEKRQAGLIFQLGSLETEIANILKRKPSKVPQPDLSPDAKDAEKNWEKVLSKLHSLRLATITDQIAKEKIELTDQYRELYTAIVKGRDLSELTDEERTALEQLWDWQATRTNQIVMKEVGLKEKAEREKAEAAIEAVMDEVNHKRDLYAWDTAQYLAELQRQLAAASLTAEERILLEKRVADAKRDLDIEIADDNRRGLRAERDEAVRVYADIRNAAVDAALAGGEAWSDFGDWLRNYFVRRIAVEVLDALFKIKEAAGDVEGGGGGGSKGGWILTALTWAGHLFGAQHGAYVRKPTVLLSGEAGQDEITSPVPMMRRIVREELAASGGGTPTQVILQIENIKAWDAAGVLESVRSGEVGRIFEEAIERGHIKISESSIRKR